MNAADVARWWGCCVINRLADRAEGYRRIAAGLAAVPVPLTVVAAGAALRNEPSSMSSTLAHLVVAIACGWLAIDLVRAGSALGSSGRPHLSSVVLLGGIVLLALVARSDASIGFGSPVLLVTGLASLVGGFVGLMAAERQHDRLLAMAGRSAVVGGAVVVGAMELGRAVAVYAGSPIEAIGLGVVGVFLVAMGWFEARVLLRGAALYRTLVRR